MPTTGLYPSTKKIYPDIIRSLPGRTSCRSWANTVFTLTPILPAMKNLVKQKFKYELQRFDNIIHHDMAHFLRHNPELDDSLIIDFQSVITDEAQIVKENLRHSVFLFNDDRVQERYIQFHQQALIGLAGHLLNYVAPFNSRTPPRSAAQPSSATSFTRLSKISSPLSRSTSRSTLTKTPGYPQAMGV